MGTGHVVVVGDVVLDREVSGSCTRLAPDAPVPVVDVGAVRESPGAAALTAALVADDPTVTVALLAPLARDEPASRLRSLLTGVSVHPLAHAGGTRTKTRVRADGQVLLRMDEGGPGTPVDTDTVAIERVLAAADTVLVSDYGAGTTRDPVLRAALAAAAQRVPVIWDPHPRGGAPVDGCALVTPNLAEARAAVQAPVGDLADPQAPPGLAEALRSVWGAHAVCVTAGADGAFCATSSGVVHVPAAPATGDPCGAGDRFAATAAVRMVHGATLTATVERAVAQASRWVAAGGTNGFCAAPLIEPSTANGQQRNGFETAAHVAARVRAGGGTLVATGGCFDVLHAGHVACLEAARELGDALVVLLNSDDSVSRLKGPHRPVVAQEDRERVLRGLSSVDAVVVFGQDDPRTALADLRPDVWVKGGDYDEADLPEADLVRSWGGRVVVLPHLAGRSTTRILTAGAGR